MLILFILYLEEMNCSIFNDGARWKDGCVINAVIIDEVTAVRLVRKGAVR